MATTSEVDSGLDGSADLIAGAQRLRSQAIASLHAAYNQLNSLPAQYADVIATVNGFTPTGAWETLAKDRLAKLTSEFTALKSSLGADLTALGETP